MRRKTLWIAAVLFVLGIAVFTACNGGGNGSSSGQAMLSGTIDSNTMTASIKPALWQRFLASLTVKNAYASGTVVDRVVAISNDNTMVVGTISGNAFSLALDKGKPYLLIFLNGTTIVGIYKVDNTTGLDVFPLSAGSNNMNLGTVSLASGVLSGTITEADLLTGLGMSSDIATAFGVMDDGFLRFSSVDVDGNGVIDFAENKHFDLHLDYEFNSNQTFASLSGLLAGYSDKASITYMGYAYYFFARPDDINLDWPSATLTPPTAISDSHGPAPSKGQCGNKTEQQDRILNFYCGDWATAPRTPPPGDYTVTVGTKTFTFKNVKSQTIDANLYDIYMPEVDLTMSGSQITQIDWRWWKKVNGTGWVQPTDKELSAVLNDAQFEIGDSTWSLANRVRGTISLTRTGSVKPASQTFTPGRFRISYYSKAGYNYGFEWY